MIMCTCLTACGLEYCVNCSRAGDKPVCFDCIEHAQIFDEECLICPLSLVAAIAIEQEEELEEELEEQRIRQLECEPNLVGCGL